MKLKIVFNKKTKMYKIKVKDNDVEGNNNRIFNNVIYNNYDTIKKMNCYVRKGEVCSFNLDVITKVKKHLDGIIMMMKLKGEI